MKIHNKRLLALVVSFLLLIISEAAIATPSSGVFFSVRDDSTNLRINSEPSLYSPIADVILEIKDCVRSTGESVENGNVRWLQIESSTGRGFSFTSFHQEYGWVPSSFLEPSTLCEEAYDLINEISDSLSTQNNCYSENLISLDETISNVTDWFSRHINNNIVVLNEEKYHNSCDLERDKPFDARSKLLTPQDAINKALQHSAIRDFSCNTSIFSYFYFAADENNNSIEIDSSPLNNNIRIRWIFHKYNNSWTLSKIKIKYFKSTCLEVNQSTENSQGGYDFSEEELIKRSRLYVGQSIGDPNIRGYATSIVANAPVNMFTGAKVLSESEAWRIYSIIKFVNDKVNYVWDPHGKEYLASPIETINLRGGDCDDYAVLLASLFENVNLDAVLAIVDKNGDTVLDHLTALVNYSGNQEQFRAELDAVKRTSKVNEDPVTYFFNWLGGEPVRIGFNYLPASNNIKTKKHGIWIVADPLFVKDFENTLSQQYKILRFFDVGN